MTLWAMSYRWWLCSPGIGEEITLFPNNGRDKHIEWIPHVFERKVTIYLSVEVLLCCWCKMTSVEGLNIQLNKPWGQTYGPRGDSYVRDESSNRLNHEAPRFCAFNVQCSLGCIKDTIQEITCEYNPTGSVYMHTLTHACTHSIIHMHVQICHAILGT